MVTEQSLEQVLEEGDVSDEEVKETEVEAEAEGEEEETEKGKKDADIDSRIQSEVDKRVNSYREKMESSTAFIRHLQEQNKELKNTNRQSADKKRLAGILTEDEDDGIPQEKVESRQAAIKDFIARETSYLNNVSQIEEAAQVIKQIADKMPPNIVKEFGLDETVPAIRAANGVKLLDEAVANIKYHGDFLMAVEAFLPKGEGVRQQLEEIVKGMAEFESVKSKNLYLKDRLKGLKVTPKNAPKTPSDIAGGGINLNKLSADELLTQGFKEKSKK